MNKLTYLVLVVLVCSSKLFAQTKSELEREKKSMLAYKRIYTYSDSVSKIQKPGVMKENVFRLADSLDNFHPKEFFKKVLELEGESQFNEASFIYHLGYSRYKFYNLSNPNYSATGDGALFTSLSEVSGEKINMYLRSNLDNFIEILKKSSDWIINHDYKFYTKSKNPEMYSQVILRLNNLIRDLEKDKEKYKAQWSKERDRNEKLFGDAIKKIDERLDKEKNTDKN